MPKYTVTIINPSGLHARPAARFVEAARSLSCDVLVKNLTTDSNTVDAKSILGILTLGVEQGHVLEINTFGDSAEQAGEDLVRLVAEELVKIDEPDQVNKDLI
jgi:phosphotransferase system HPr (HPr) family protein